MIHLVLLFAHVFLLVVAGSELSAPGAQDCPPLHVGHRVVAEHSCTHASSPEGTVCSFSCHKGFKLDGPEVKHCQMDGTWTDADAAVVCNDINECDTMNGFCSHICKNTPGGYECACPDPFYLDPTDQRTCKAHGVSLTCDPNHMKIVLPKSLVEHDLGHEHLSLLDESDPKCRANGNATHYILATANTECGTTSHLYKNFVVYTNRVIESPNDDSDVITTVGKNEIKVPFSCYYNDLEIVHTVGFKPVAQKIHVYVKGRGEYALSLDIFKNSGYGESRLAAPSSPKYTEDDFPISVHLRERVYVQASLDTRETDLKIFASNCCTTPMRDHEATIKFRHALIVEGCPKDPSVQFHHTSDPTKLRFSFKAFKFLGDHDYVFVHCRVHVCDANDANSRCAQGCAATPIPVHDIGKQSEKLQPAKKQDKKPLVQPKELAKKLVAQPHPDQDSKGDKHPIAQDETKRTMKRPESPEKRNKKPLVQAKTKRGKKMTDGASNKGEKKVQNRETPQKKETEGAAKRLMKRATKRPANKGVLGTGDLSDGPFILDVPGKEQTKRKRPFVHAKRDEIERDEKQKKTGRSTVPSSSDILLVALTVASILALVGIAVLGRRATKTANNPYDYQPLSVSQ